MISEYTQHFQKTFNFTPNRNQFCFIDNGVNENPYAEDLEKQMYRKAMDHIKQFTKNQQPFACRDIKEVLKEKDSLLLQIKQVEQERKEELKKFNDKFAELEKKNSQTQAQLQAAMQHSQILQSQIQSL